MQPAYLNLSMFFWISVTLLGWIFLGWQWMITRKQRLITNSSTNTDVGIEMQVMGASVQETDASSTSHDVGNDGDERETPILHTNRATAAEQHDKMYRSHSLVDEMEDGDEGDTPNVRRRCNTHHAAFRSESTTHLLGAEEVQETASSSTSLAVGNDGEERETPILHSNRATAAEQHDEMYRSHSLVDQASEDGDERETPIARRRCNTHHAAFLSESTTHLLGAEEVQVEMRMPSRSVVFRRNRAFGNEEINQE